MQVDKKYNFNKWELEVINASLVQYQKFLEDLRDAVIETPGVNVGGDFSYTKETVEVLLTKIASELNGPYS